MSEPFVLKKDHKNYKVVLEAEVIGEFIHARSVADRLLEMLKREFKSQPLFYSIKKCTIDVPGMYD